MELIEEFMLRADRYSLQEICRTNSITAEICRDDFFWKKKLEIDFGTYLKFPNKTYKEMWIVQPYIMMIPISIAGVDGHGNVKLVTRDIPEEKIEKFIECTENVISDFNKSENFDYTVHFLNIEYDDEYQEGYHLYYYLKNDFGFPFQREESLTSNTNGINDDINDFLLENFNGGHIIYTDVQEFEEMNMETLLHDMVDIEIFYLPFF